MRAALALLVSAAVLVPPTSAAMAQELAAGGSVLWLVPPAGRIESGTEQTGSLSSSDFFGPTDVFLDVWEVQGRAGSSVTIDMKSDDFDAVLFVVGPGLSETLWDDDSGGDCDARVTVRFLEDGTYRIAATTTVTRTTGFYTLIASASPAAASTVPCGGPDPAAFAALPVAGRIAAGESVTGTLDAGDPLLTDESRAEVWEIAGEQGRTLTIRLESDAFDAFLYVLGPGLEGVLTDDDGGGDLHSRLVVTLPQTGTYRIIASSVEPGGSGSYRLSVAQ